MRFSEEEIRRYARQIVLPDLGGAGQEALRAATVTAASELEALYLAAAGVGTIVVPTDAIAEAARALNPLVRVEVGNVPGCAAAEASVEQASLFAWRAIKEAVGL
jgi:molybdopterin/thiamine biosynthesis adenylyltransferase